LRGHDRADAGLVEQRRCERADVGEQLSLELVGFDRCRLDAAGEAFQHYPGGDLVDAGGVAATQAAAAVEQLADREPTSLLA